jgi:hypothetical protein
MREFELLTHALRYWKTSAKEPKFERKLRHQVMITHEHPNSDLLNKTSSFVMVVTGKGGKRKLNFHPGAGKG